MSTVYINEIQPNPTGSDPSTVSVEFRGMPGAGFSGFLYSIEADNALPQSVDRKAAVSGIFDVNGLLTVQIPDLENPSFTLVLADGTATANAGDSFDGTNAAIFGNILDAIGIPDSSFDEANVQGAALGGQDFAYTGDEPRLIFRDGITRDWYAVNDPDRGEVIDIDGNVVDPAGFDIDPTAGTDTFGAVNPTTATPINVLISEIQPNPTGSDPSMVSVEISGMPGASFSGFLYSIEADNALPQSIDRKAAIAGTFDANGLLTVQIPDLENPSFTLVLADATATADAGDSFDGTNAAIFGNILDAIGVPDSVFDELTVQGAALGGQDFAYTGDEPRLIFRDGSTGDWYAVNDPDRGNVIDIDGNVVDPASFNTDPTAGTDTFGVLNPTQGGGTGPTETLTVTIAADEISETDGAAATTATVTRTGTTGDLTVTLISSDTSEATVPATVTIQDGQTSASFDIDAVDDSLVDGTQTVTITASAAGASNGSDTVDVTSEDVPVLTAIYDIQGRQHTSPLLGQALVTSGIVTAVDSNGFYLQDPDGDGDIATSDALFVFTGSAPGVAAGDAVNVSGTVSEFTPGGSSSGNLSTTQLSGVSVTTTSTGNVLPAATIIGQGGRVPVSGNIDDDAFGSFDPATDGIDFFESLEGMLVTAQDLMAVAATSRFGEIFAVVDQGADATGVSQRGTLNIAPDDLNPEKIQIDEDSGVFDFNFPNVDVGALLGDVTGVVGYSFGTFEIYPTADFTPQIVASTLTAETTSLTGSADQLTIASYNALNLDPNDNDGDTDVGSGRFDAIAAQIVANLGTPDIIGLQEIQDNNGTEGGTGTGVVSADVTLQMLVDAIVAAGGPTYSFIDNTFITEDASGGFPGGNIRTAFLYDASRVTLDPSSVQTIDGQGAGQAFAGARLPLVADFDFNGETVTVVNNHFSSKGGSAPIMGTSQDVAARQEDLAVNGSLDERREQAQAVNDFVDTVLAADSDANVVVLGDLNEFEFVSPLKILDGSEEVTGGDPTAPTTATPGNQVLTNLTNTVAEDERYSFIFQGNSQELDHVLVSDSLLAGAEIDTVHTNVEFAATAGRASDHDPVVTRFTFAAETPLNLAGTFDNDALVGAGADDKILMRYGQDSATGNGGADQFVIDSRFMQSGDMHTVTDLNFGEGDWVQFAFFDQQREIRSDADLQFYLDNDYARIVTPEDSTGAKAVKFLNFEDNFASEDDRFIGTAKDDSFNGAAGNDFALLRYGNDSATGGTGADEFRFDARYMGTGSTHTVTDLDFAEGDVLSFAFFAPNRVDAASTADLLALDSQSWIDVLDTGTGFELTLNNGGDSMTVLV